MLPKGPYLRLDTWAGRLNVPVEMVSETPERYRVRLLADCQLPNRRDGYTGDVILVPKYAIGGLEKQEEDDGDH